ncbi:MAG: hypothetical protein ABIM99_06430 [Candidatus Dojkabacteria bacterium]
MEIIKERISPKFFATTLKEFVNQPQKYLTALARLSSFAFNEFQNPIDDNVAYPDTAYDFSGIDFTHDLSEGQDPIKFTKNYKYLLALKMFHTDLENLIFLVSNYSEYLKIYDMSNILKTSVQLKKKNITLQSDTSDHLVFSLCKICDETIRRSNDN